jgi:hypothetical protein
MRKKHSDLAWRETERKKQKHETEHKIKRSTQVTTHFPFDGIEPKQKMGMNLWPSSIVHKMKCSTCHRREKYKKNHLPIDTSQQLFHTILLHEGEKKSN